MAKLLEENEIDENIKKLSTWEKLKATEIRRELGFMNFSQALSFVNEVGRLAESMDHHPDIFLHDYKFVTLTLTTHSEKGLTRLDFDLAARIDKAFLDATGTVS